MLQTLQHLALAVAIGPVAFGSTSAQSHPATRVAQATQPASASAPASGDAPASLLAGCIGMGCFPGAGATISCPCSNPPAGGGAGCDNFGGLPAESSTLCGSGLPSLSADTLVLSASGENNTALTVFFAGSGMLNPTGVVLGAGVRCVMTSLKRLYVGPASGGAIARPGASDPSVSARSATLGVPISAGETRHYFNVYRDPLAAGPCGNTGSTVNTTNSLSINWSP